MKPTLIASTNSLLVDMTLAKELGILEAALIRRAYSLSLYDTTTEGPHRWTKRPLSEWAGDFNVTEREIIRCLDYLQSIEFVLYGRTERIGASFGVAIAVCVDNINEFLDSLGK